MNKALAISLLVICNMAAICVLSVVNLYALFQTTKLTVTVLIGLAAVTVLGFVSSRLLPVFIRKYSLKARWFILAAYVSPIIGAAVYWIIYLILEATGYLSGWFDGHGEGLYAVSLSPTAVAYLISGAVWSALAKHRLNAKKSPN